MNEDAWKMPHMLSHNDVVYRPKKIPLFHVDLVLDQSGVHYSTPIENFETSMRNLLEKGILCTHNVPQLEKVTYMSIDRL